MNNYIGRGICYLTNIVIIFSIDMAYDEDCSGDGLVSYWGNDFDACADGGGRYIFGREADIQVRHFI